ncbi:MAG: endonuclease/exonuclease/phosphatase family protein [Candidatus Latescibacteria bacterium]|nr:endonuclease/exonuclease/phosphatase family protein [Candidatus Latescibacterota bacterium]
MRTITYNVYRWRCWPEGAVPRERCKVEPLKDVVAVKLFAEALGRYEPDVITLCEAWSDSIVRGIAERLGMDAVIFPGGNSPCPGALLTRFDILESVNCPLVSTEQRPPELFTRHWGRVVLSTDSGELVVYSAHLLSRPEEISEVIAVMQDDLQSGRSLLLQGDLNHEPEEPAYERWQEAGLTDTFALAGTGPGETCRADRPSQRIDYIFAHGPIVRRLRECRVLGNASFRIAPGRIETSSNETDFSDGRAWFLSDHLPVMATFE